MNFPKICSCLCLIGGAVLAAACSTGPPVKLDPESDAFFQSARLIMTREENKIFTRLPDADARKEFITDFWAKRDPDPNTEENRFKLDFEGRVSYANTHFREGGPGYNTDRGRIYIFMGPPDKIDEYLMHNDPSVRGSVVYWVYYDYQLAIEFIDEKGINQYKISRYDGNFFEALDSFKLGEWVMTGGVFRKKFVKFDLDYDRNKEEITISIPADRLSFTEDEEGRFQVDLEFIFYIYPDEGARKETFRDRKVFSATNAELLDMKRVPFVFSRTLAPGTNFVDVIVQGGGEMGGKIRKIFEVKVSL